MIQQERRTYLIKTLLAEQPRFADIEIPQEAQDQRDLLRSLLNIRGPHPVSSEFLKVQDAYLREETRQKGITDAEELTPLQGELYLWKGDITTLKCDAIVNAANSRMLGCFVPCHGCIDNAIHTYAGVQLRAACARIMERQGHEEPVGTVKITPAFNLPCRYVLHTVGPIVAGTLTAEDEGLLASCYESCLDLAAEKGIKSIAFCCISTGEFHFPNGRAAEIAVKTVQAYKARTGSRVKVIFNVFQERDYGIYRELLG